MLFKKIFSSQKGIAFDELALASAVVASVGTFAVVTVPWDTVFTSTPERIVQNATVIEQANLSFYERYRMWPHEVTNGNWANNMSVLVNQDSMKFPYSTMRSFVRLLPEDRFQYDQNTSAVTHSFGQGGRVLQRPIQAEGESYLEVIFEDVPLVEARNVDLKIDGIYDPEEGLVTIDFEDSLIDTDTVTLRYRANKI